MKKLIVVLGGMIFGAGLAHSTMTQPEIVLSFLRLENLGLGLVMVGAIGVTSICYALGPKLLKTPLFGNTFQKFKAETTKKRILGAVLFGIGWGISGLCPGAALGSIGTGNYPVLFGLLGMIVGTYVNDIWLK
jgi:uncharacterized protein